MNDLLPQAISHGMRAYQARCLAQSPKETIFDQIQFFQRRIIVDITKAFPRRTILLASVYCAALFPAISANAASPSQPDSAAVSHSADTEKSPLPEAVAAMRRAILKAARSGDLEQMRPVLETNELTPLFSFGGGTDPMAFWKENSEDGKGRTMLARMVEVLDMPYVIEGKGTKDAIYIWPYLYSLDFNKLTPAQEVDAYRLMSAKDLKSMREFGGYLDYRLGISRDGTWQFFVAGD
jgi:hypothetical protein